MSIDKMVEGAAEMRAWADMVGERIPGLKPALEEKMTEVAEMIAEVFQPWVDLADGKITEEEFCRIMAEREARDLAARHAMWDDVEQDGEWLVECSEDDCYEDLAYEELPPLWPTCEDLTGISCVPEEEEDES